MPPCRRMLAECPLLCQGSLPTYARTPCNARQLKLFPGSTYSQMCLTAPTQHHLIYITLIYTYIYIDIYITLIYIHTLIYNTFDFSCGRAATSPRATAPAASPSTVRRGASAPAALQIEAFGPTTGPQPTRWAAAPSPTRVHVFGRTSPSPLYCPPYCPGRTFPDENFKYKHTGGWCCLPAASFAQLPLHCPGSVPHDALHGRSEGVVCTDAGHDMRGWRAWRRWHGVTKLASSLVPFGAGHPARGRCCAQASSPPWGGRCACSPVLTPVA